MSAVPDRLPRCYICKITSLREGSREKGMGASFSALLMLSGCGLSEAEIEAAAKAAEQAKQAEIIASLKNKLTRNFLDPNAAQFRDERLVVGKMDGSYVLCGEVNVKGSEGGYLGFARFVATANATSNHVDKAGSVGEVFC